MAETNKPKTNGEDPILNMAEAGRQLGKHRSTVLRWVREGLMKSGKHPNGARYVRQSEVNRWLKFQKNE